MCVCVFITYRVYDFDNIHGRHLVATRLLKSTEYLLLSLIPMRDVKFNLLFWVLFCREGGEDNCDFNVLHFFKLFKTKKIVFLTKTGLHLRINIIGFSIIGIKLCFLDLQCIALVHQSTSWVRFKHFVDLQCIVFVPCVHLLR